ncbi:FKBP-type peptidyl-prolyl cis-trans isomerase [Enterobacter sp. CC120223-11]|uniref:FKBP-type peptidyl-prolyl cis-trans isomerase n=1 Tax=Enterobacter sp. CC120223-11 TaxID=1378073 RepID=UPI000BCE65FA|nr:FKBP-type peptidyl-prolyl cis-trans isomerase [Enterobacter sp. CC120223-11]SNY62265.1 FKBP-type peptidyl-prolyl cis-trans isomerase [Enterobacter sp. CC120223-11]
MPEYVALQKKLAESQKQRNQLEIQQKSVQQQLEEKSQQLAAMSKVQSGEKALDDGQKAQLTDLQNQNAALKKQITTLTASQISNSLELAAAKTLESQAVSQLKKQLAESQDKAVALTAQITDLTAKTAATEKAAEARSSDDKTVAALKQSLSQSQREAEMLKKSLAESQTASAALQQQIATLTSSQSEDVKTLAQIKQQLSESQTRTAALTKQLATLDSSQDDTGKAAGQMKAALEESQKVAKDLLAKNTALIADNKRKEEHIAVSQKSLLESQKDRDEMNKSLKDASGKVKAQEKQLTELRNRKSAAVVTPEPKSQNEMRSYALGTLWGHEVNGAMRTVESDGITLELSQVISGVSDTLNGKFRIPRQKIIEQLDVMNKQAMAKRKPAESSASNDFLQSFSKKPGTKRDGMGYYYRVLNKGDGKITSSNVVAISVKESLANGKVIKDMTKTGNVLSLPLANFPPLFSSAIGKMNNKGKMIMAVPPELAYGEQGRPPEIPPNATMVYEITVMDVRPAEGK